MDKLIRIIIWPVWIAPLIYLAIAGGHLPDRVPLHYDISGDPDRYGSKLEFFIVIGFIIAVNIGTNFLIVNLNRIDPKKKYRASNISPMRKLAFAVSVFLSAI